ncbi:MAG: Na/Pi cotransporter family protein [Kiritimatiellia bacterium]
MSGVEIFLSAFRVIGGMSLFIYGMHVMTHGLRAAAGSSLRKILAHAARRRWQGFLLGGVVGFLAHSGAATTMIAGFINAGLMGLADSIAPMAGANLGTSLSMQLVSFHIGHYCWVAIGLGYIMSAALPNPRVKETGRALMGFGLLFLGMTTISDAIAPHKDALAPWLARIHGETWSGRLAGVGLSALLTALITSSGAMIGLCFALATAGVFTTFDQVFPIVMGSHIGTCIVALTASMAMNADARRSALGHLLFNLLNVTLALALYPWVRDFVVWSAGGNLLREIANLHTAGMALGSLAVLPAVPVFAWVLRKLLPSRLPPPEPSYLKDELQERPEQALRGVVCELRRMAKLCVDCAMLNGDIMFHAPRNKIRRLLADEGVINEVKDAMSDYLRSLSQRSLTRRQSLFMQHLDRCMKDIERIGDHLTSISEISTERLKHPAAIVPEALFTVWFDLFRAGKEVLVLMEKSFDADAGDFHAAGRHILEARDRYFIMSMDAKAELAGAVADRTITPVGGYYMNRYIADLDRTVRHAKSIALAEIQPDFSIKHERLEEVSPLAAEAVVPEKVDADEYLKSLQDDDLFDDDERDSPGFRLR